MVDLYIGLDLCNGTVLDHAHRITFTAEDLCVTQQLCALGTRDIQVLAEEDVLTVREGPRVHRTGSPARGGPLVHPQLRQRSPVDPGHHGLLLGLQPAAGTRSPHSLIHLAKLSARLGVDGTAGVPCELAGTWLGFLGPVTSSLLPPADVEVGLHRSGPGRKKIKFR